MTDKEEITAQNGEETTKEKLIRDIVKNLLLGGEESRKKLQTFIDSDRYKAIEEALSNASASIYNLFRDHGNGLMIARTRGPEVENLYPYLCEAFQEVKDSGQLEGMTIPDLFSEGFDENGRATSVIFKQIIDRAKELKEIDEATTEEEDAEKLTTAPVLSILYPLDKVNSTIWSLLDTEWDNGYTNLFIDTATPSERKEKKQAIINFEMTFNTALSKVNVDVRLDDYDKRVFIAYYSLLKSGNTGFSASQIYTEMGQRSNAPAEDIIKINTSLNKMRAATITMSNDKEIELHKSTPKYSVIDSSFLPFVRKRTYINNTICEDTIVPLMIPPLATFFEQRGQYITLSREVLQSPINKTPTALAIEHYLLARIGHMKNKRKNTVRKILFSAIYENCHITDRRYKARAKETVYKFLDNYKKTGFITDYAKLADGITINP